MWSQRQCTKRYIQQHHTRKDISLYSVFSSQELVVRLTDETDPFFLFTLALGEEDFQG